MPTFSKTQIDKLGERLRTGAPSEEDLRILNEYRRSFEPVYQYVVNTIRNDLSIDPTGRPAKSTSSIIEKLRRPKTRGYRFSQIQDIAGCRIVLPDLSAQNDSVEKLMVAFPNARQDDLRIRPSHGYRAVHIIVKIDSMSVEIQVRSRLQHSWAEMCEQLADRFDPMIKYGGGSEEVKANLLEHSELAYMIEKIGITAMNKSEISALKERMERAIRQTIILFGRKVP
jgi:putative GTP pyrophosphokinase